MMDQRVVALGGGDRCRLFADLCAVVFLTGEIDVLPVRLVVGVLEPVLDGAAAGITRRRGRVGKRDPHARQSEKGAQHEGGSRTSKQLKSPYFALSDLAPGMVRLAVSV